MATTSPDNIWTPDSGDDYALTVDLAAMADTIQDALNAIHNVLDPLADDTGWVSTGLTITTDTPTWTLVNYQLRRRGGRVDGRVRVNRATTGPTTDGASNIPDEPILVLPEGWRPSVGPEGHVSMWRSGLTEWFARTSNDGTVRVTHGAGSGIQMVAADYELFFSHYID